MRGDEIIFNLLTGQECDQFMSNVRNQDRMDVAYSFMNREINPGTYGMIITHCISWSDTPEGYDYWCDIFDRLNEPNIKRDKLSPIKRMRKFNLV